MLSEDEPKYKSSKKSLKYSSAVLVFMIILLVISLTVYKNDIVKGVYIAGIVVSGIAFMFSGFIVWRYRGRINTWNEKIEYHQSVI